MDPLIPKSTKKESNKVLTPLPAEIQRSLEEVLDKIVAIEKSDYHNDLVPFSQHEKQIREKGHEVINSLINAIEQGQKVLKDFFELEEKEHPEIDREAHYARWEEASQKLKGMPTLLDIATGVIEEEEPLQKQCGLSWAFMDRAYATATKLKEDKRIEDAANIFKLLRYLNSNVFEYWLSEADALFDLGKYEEALDVYGQSLLLQPENPHAFYQIGSCWYELDKFENSMTAFDACIEYAKASEDYSEYVTMATDAKRFVESKKVA